MACSLFKQSKSKAFVWFADESLLAMGNIDLVEDVGKVLSGDKDSLADTDRWSDADMPKGDMVAFFDSEL